MRTRTPTAVLELNGSFKKNPGRRREREGEPIVKDALPPPPSRLSGPEKAAWNELRDAGFWLTAADVFMVEIAASLMAKHRANEIDNPARSLLVSTLAKLGFGPTERSKIKLPEKEESTDFDQFMR
jgi:hypothetical protein